MVDLKRNSVRMYDRGIPKVKFESVETELAISNLFETDRNIYEYFGLVLLRLGYRPEDDILIYNYDKDYNFFMCTANKNNTCQMWIDKVNHEIVLSKFNYVYGYECVPEERSEIGMKISLGRYIIRYEDGVTLTRYLSRDKAKFVVSVCDSILELELDRPNDVELKLFDENGRYAKYKLSKEDELIEYLSKEAIDKSLVDIYKDLCERYLGDVSRYPDFSLKQSVITEEGKEMVTDLIHLKNGKLENFGETDHNKMLDMTVFVDKDDNWSLYWPKCETVPVDFSMTSNDGIVTCTFSVDDEKYYIGDYIKDMINSDVKNATYEVVKTRRRVREIFGENKGSN